MSFCDLAIHRFDFILRTKYGYTAADQRAQFSKAEEAARSMAVELGLAEPDAVTYERLPDRYGALWRSDWKETSPDSKHVAGWWCIVLDAFEIGNAQALVGGHDLTRLGELKLAKPIEADYSTTMISVEWEGAGFETLGRLSLETHFVNRAWLSTAFGLVGLPEKDTPEWIVALERVRPGAQDAFAQFTRTVGPEIMLRMEKCRVIGERLQLDIQQTNQQSAALARADEMRAPESETHHELLQSLRVSSRAITDHEHDLKTLNRNIDGLEVLLDFNIFVTERAQWKAALLSRPRDNADNAQYDLDVLRIGYEAGERAERAIATQVAIRNERFQWKFTVLLSVFAVAGVGQLIPDQFFELRAWTVFGAIVVLAVWLLWQKRASE